MIFRLNTLPKKSLFLSIQEIYPFFASPLSMLEFAVQLKDTSSFPLSLSYTFIKRRAVGDVGGRF